MQTRIVFIRHGETDWNKERRYLSRTDIDINDTGKAQVLAAAEALAKENISRVYSSDLKRAVNSAKLLFNDLPIERSVDFREMDFGVFEGLRYEEIVAGYKDICNAWIDDPRTTTIPKGEPFEDFQARVMGKIAAIIRDNPAKTIAVATHGGVIRLVLYAALKPERFWSIKMVMPGKVMIVEADEKGNFAVKQYEPEGDAWPKQVKKQKSKVKSAKPRPL